MFLVDTEQGRIVEDEEIKAQIVNERPYARLARSSTWCTSRTCPRRPRCRSPSRTRCCKRQVAFGYTFEDQRILMAPMARDGVEAVGSMGNDTPLAVLSHKSRMLYDYFKQLFAQVTNPPIDCIREEIITSSDVWLGSEGNLLDPQPGDCRRLELPVADAHQRRVRQGAAHGRCPGSRSARCRSCSAPSAARRASSKPMEELRAEGAAADRGGRGQHPHPLAIAA